MQAIITKYLGPTNKRGSRIKARQSASYAGTPQSITIAWDYGLNVEHNHKAAAIAFAAKMGWHGNWAGGSGGGESYIFVNVDAAADERMTFTQDQAEAAA